MRFLLIALTLTATAAWSQTTGLQLSLPNNVDELRLPKEPCDLTRTVTWTHSIALTPCDDLKFWFVEGSCSDEPPSGTTPIETVARNNVLNSSSGTVDFEIGDLPGFTEETACPAAGKEVTYRLCASVPIPGGVATDCSSKNYQRDDVVIIYDAKPPAAPTIESVVGLDKALSVRVDPPDDASEVTLELQRVDGSGATRTATQSADQPLFRVENLENDVTYRVTARAVDVAENVSEPSETQEGTPILTRGFLDRYVEYEGAETGGCGAAAGGLAGGWVLAVLGFWLSSRRNRS